MTFEAICIHWLQAKSRLESTVSSKSNSWNCNLMFKKTCQIQPKVL